MDLTDRARAAIQQWNVTVENVNSVLQPIVNMIPQPASRMRTRSQSLRERQRQKPVARIKRLDALKKWSVPTSHHHVLQTAKGIDLCNRLWQLYQRRKHWRQRIQPHIKNDKCFLTMESYNKATNPGPYFYHVHTIDDGKTMTVQPVMVFEFDPTPLADYVASSNNPVNPFNKQRFTRVELMRLDRLARFKNPGRSPLNIDRILQGPRNDDDNNNPFQDDQLRQVFLQHILQDLEMEQKHVVSTQTQMQQLFQQDPAELMSFVRSQVYLAPSSRDQNWFQFMSALTGLAARRFARLNLR